MLILGIDTSTLVGSVGLLNDNAVLGEFTLNIKRTHSERLLPALDTLLRETGVSLAEIDLISVAQGPGSFTGLRIGVTTANSLAQAAEKNIIGVTSLEVLADNLAYVQGLICPILDARKGEVYTCLHRTDGKGGQEQILSPSALTIDRLLEIIHQENDDVYFTGDAVKVYEKYLQEKLGQRYTSLPSSLLIPRGCVVARLGWQKWQKGKQENFPLQPLYLRKSEAELAWEKKQGG